jgi:hypothetical protein
MTNYLLIILALYECCCQLVTFGLQFISLAVTVIDNAWASSILLLASCWRDHHSIDCRFSVRFEAFHHEPFCLRKKNVLIHHFRYSEQTRCTFEYAYLLWSLLLCGLLTYLFLQLWTDLPSRVTIWSRRIATIFLPIAHSRVRRLYWQLFDEGHRSQNVLVAIRLRTNVIERKIRQGLERLYSLVKAVDWNEMPLSNDLSMLAPLQSAWQRYSCDDDWDHLSNGNSVGST